MNSQYESFLKEVRQKTKAARQTVPEQRQLFRQKYSFSHHPVEDQIYIWDHVWNNSNEYWPKIQAFFYLETIAENKEHLTSYWPIINKWQDSADTWMYCDSLSKIYTKILEHIPDEIYRTLVNWNTSEDLWKRRQSIVSLLYYSRTKKQFLSYKKIIALIEPLLSDGEYYVQKGVGWALRETYNVYPEETWKFMLGNYQKIHSIAFSAATEKLPVELKEQLKSLRAKKQ